MRAFFLVAAFAVVLSSCVTAGPFGHIDPEWSELKKQAYRGNDPRKIVGKYWRVADHRDHEYGEGGPSGTVVFGSWFKENGTVLSVVSSDRSQWSGEFESISEKRWEMVGSGEWRVPSDNKHNGYSDTSVWVTDSHLLTEDTFSTEGFSGSTIRNVYERE